MLKKIAARDDKRSIKRETCNLQSPSPLRIVLTVGSIFKSKIKMGLRPYGKPFL